MHWSDIPDEARDHPFVGQLVQKFNGYCCVCVAVMPVVEFHRVFGPTDFVYLKNMNESRYHEFYILGIWRESIEAAVEAFENWDEEIVHSDSVIAGNYVADCSVID